MRSQPQRQVNKSTRIIILSSLVGGVVTVLLVVLNAHTWADNTNSSGIAWALRGLGFFTVHGGPAGVIYLGMLSWLALMGIAFTVRQAYRYNRTHKTSRAQRDL